VFKLLVHGSFDNFYTIQDGQERQKYVELQSKAFELYIAVLAMVVGSENSSNI
jgi:hypothetical protein